ncbi:hypothetical protein [Viscerimonas tarda]
METSTKKTAKANAKVTKPKTAVKKSKFTEFWEKNPNGILTIVDRRAILK